MFSDNHDDNTQTLAQPPAERRQKNMTFAIPVPLHRRLKAAAANEGRTLADILKESALDWLEKRGY